MKLTATNIHTNITYILRYREKYILRKSCLKLLYVFKRNDFSFYRKIKKRELGLKNDDFEELAKKSPVIVVLDYS